MADKMMSGTESKTYKVICSLVISSILILSCKASKLVSSIQTSASPSLTLSEKRVCLEGSRTTVGGPKKTNKIGGYTWYNQPSGRKVESYQLRPPEWKFDFELNKEAIVGLNTTNNDFYEGSDKSDCKNCSSHYSFGYQYEKEFCFPISKLKIDGNNELKFSWWLLVWANYSYLIYDAHLKTDHKSMMVYDYWQRDQLDYENNIFQLDQDYDRDRFSISDNVTFYFQLKDLDPDLYSDISIKTKQEEIENKHKHLGKIVREVEALMTSANSEGATVDDRIKALSDKLKKSEITLADLLKMDYNDPSLVGKLEENGFTSLAQEVRSLLSSEQQQSENLSDASEHMHNLIAQLQGAVNQELLQNGINPNSPALYDTYAVDHLDIDVIEIPPLSDSDANIDAMFTENIYRQIASEFQVLFAQLFIDCPTKPTKCIASEKRVEYLVLQRRFAQSFEQLSKMFKMRKGLISLREQKAFIESFNQINQTYVTPFIDKYGFLRDSAFGITEKLEIGIALDSMEKDQANTLKAILNSWESHGLSKQQRATLELIVALKKCSESIADDVSDLAEHARIALTNVSQFTVLAAATVKSASKCAAIAATAGDAGDFSEVITGKSICTGEELSAGEKLFSAIGVIIGSGVVYRKAGEAIEGATKLFNRAKEIVDSAKKITRHNPINPGVLHNKPINEIILLDARGVPIPNSTVADTFRSGTYMAIETKQPVTLYRTYSDPAAKFHVI